MSVAGFPFVFLLPETYSPKILEHRAEKLRKAGQTNARAMTEIHAKTTMQVVQGHVVRPLCESFRCSFYLPERRRAETTFGTV